MQGKRAATKQELAEFCISADFHCDQPLCHRELLLKAVLGVVRPRIVPFLERFFGVKELLYLANIVSVGENQLHHTIRMVELAALLPGEVLDALGIAREELLEGVLFHDIGKGNEVDDSFFDARAVAKSRVPLLLRSYPGMRWAEWKTPFHDHVARSVEIARKYGLSARVQEGIALHHHVKIRPRTLNLVGDALCLTGIVKHDIFNYNPEQYAAPGCNLAQTIAILDQLCAIERKFQARVSLGLEPQQIEDEVVRDLVIGITGAEDPRLRVLDVSLTGDESVILLDLRAFGSFVKLHTEYEIQNIKVSILQLMRSLVRVNRAGRERDLVALIGGDEYAVITKVKDPRILEEMIERIAVIVKQRTGFEVRSGFGTGGKIPENFHQARLQAEINKRCRFLRPEAMSQGE
ncbi:MAG: HDIG domain-containing protein [Firmicutes bacterium]|nr:HDIG domain-containing protein [Bacillota bacterium]